VSLPVRAIPERPAVLALTQGDPAGVGPEILLKHMTAQAAPSCAAILLAERAALEALRSALPQAPWDRLR
jgi:4-hydroxy-L-threonine phosphate dehydrogenase PdxA